MTHKVLICRKTNQATNQKLVPYWSKYLVKICILGENFDFTRILNTRIGSIMSPPPLKTE